jgi:hypothetical protein
MALDPGWVWAILTGSEALAGQQMVRSFRAPGRFVDAGDGIRQAKADGYAGHVTQALSALTERVIDVREPGHETEDGPVEPQPVADVLARTDLLQEVDVVIAAFEEAVDAKRCCRRCRHVHLALGATLLPVMLLLPIPLWPYLERPRGEDLLNGGVLHAADTVLALAIVASLILFFISIWAENALSTALQAQKPDRARIGS